ncbi:MAG: GAF domain-containing protein, partial [Actinomycetes bacterium]
MPTEPRHNLLVRRRLLEGDREERFQRIVRLAARLIGTPIAMINLQDETTQWSKATVGIEGEPLPVGETFCRRVVQTGSAQVVPDLRDDEEFHGLALVTSEPHYRFYAAEPLRLDDQVVGTLCVIDTAPRTLSDDQRDLLHELAGWAQSELDNADLNELLNALRDREARLSALLDAVPEGVLLVDDDKQVTAANHVGRGMLGAERRSLDELFPMLSIDAPPFTDRRGHGGLRAGEVLPQETTMRDAEGARPVEVSVVRLGQAKWNFLVLVRDLADLARAEAVVRRQERVTT